MNLGELYSKLNEIEKLLKEQYLLQKEILNINEAAKYLGISKSHLYKLTSGGEIPYYKPGGKLVYFNRKELDEWILTHKIHSTRELQSMAENYMITKRL